MQAKSALVLTCCSLLLLTRAGGGDRTASAPPDRDGQLKEILMKEWWRGHRLFQAQAYHEAAEVFQAGRRAASRGGASRLEMHFLTSLGACHFATFQYRRAMEAYLEARGIAGRISDWKIEAGLCSNIATVYSQMGEIQAARQAAEEALSIERRRNPAHPQAPLLVRVASLRERQGDMASAIPLFARGIEEADRLGDLGTQAQAWNQLGHEYLRRGQLREAEEAMLREFRLRRLNGNKDIHLSYRNLGMLRTAQGDFRSAGRLLDEAVRAAPPSAGFVPLWTIFRQRGELRFKEGRLAEALAEFRRALDLARRWRLEALPADAFRVSLDVGLQQLYSSLVEAAVALYFRTGRAELAHEAFEAAEENRAASLRASLLETEDGRPALPPEYGEKLAQLHAAEIALLKNDDPAARRKAEGLRHELTEIELRAGLESATGDRWHASEARLLERTQRALRASEAFLGFHVGEAESYVWAVAQDGFRVHRAPGRARLVAETGAFLEAVRSNSGEVIPRGKGLYQDLFGRLDADVRDRPHWIVALDDALFELPLAALVTEVRDGRPVFLIERHSLQITPNAHLLASATPSWWTGPFVGVGDGIYNTADPRWRGAGARSGFWRLVPHLKAKVRAEASLQLARLPGSGREIRASARAWSPAEPVLLEGPAACGRALRQALARRPSVLHFAAHVVASKPESERGLIVLSLQPNGQPEVLSAATVRDWRPGADLVVLSGCSSGQGEALPGAGLMGLTRAWLAAGSGAVVASRWPTPDDSGELFLSFYRHLQQSGQPGQARHPDVALQQAQQEMLRSGNWRSLPRFWAAYFVAGRG